MSYAQFSHLNPNMLAILRASTDADATLLITGNTGTGKSHLAYALHLASVKRSSGQWSKVNLATLSENLIESELFGHERGAFTGADSRRVGRLEACNGGTVFLDEIGELPLRLQAKLLDFIQYKKISPVGSNREITIDVRIIAATNRNLEAAVKAGEFRADLYHRLNVFHVRLPDMATNSKLPVQFAMQFLEERAQENDNKRKILSKEVEQIFRRYQWPGNIRELQHVIEFADAMTSKEEITVSSLPVGLQEFAKSEKILGVSDEVESRDQCDETPQMDFPVIKIEAANAVGLIELPVTMSFHDSREAFERAYIEQALRLCCGQINLTSRRIGLNKVSLTDKIKRYEIDWRSIRRETLGPALKTA